LCGQGLGKPVEPWKQSHSADAEALKAPKRREALRPRDDDLVPQTSLVFDLALHVVLKVLMRVSDAQKEALLLNLTGVPPARLNRRDEKAAKRRSIPGDSASPFSRCSLLSGSFLKSQIIKTESC
jgi:hypothetical protein